MKTHSSVLVQRIPIDRGAWWATHGVTKGWTWLSTAQHIYGHGHCGQEKNVKKLGIDQMSHGPFGKDPMSANLLTCKAVSGTFGILTIAINMHTP